MRIERRHQNERGLAVLIALMLIALMLVFVMANSAALFHLKREIKLTDQRQRQHWERTGGTNTPPATNATK